MAALRTDPSPPPPRDDAARILAVPPPKASGTGATKDPFARGVGNGSGRESGELCCGHGIRLAPRPRRADGGRGMVIEVRLAADGPDAATTTVSTTIEVNTTDPRWPAWLV